MSFKCPNCGGTYFSSHNRGGGIAGTGRCDDQFLVGCKFQWSRSDNNAENQVFCRELSFEDGCNPAVLTPHPILQNWVVDYTVFKAGSGIAVVSGKLTNVPQLNNIPLLLDVSSFRNPCILPNTVQVAVQVNDLQIELGIPANQDISKKQQLEELFEKVRFDPLTQ